MPCMCWYEPNDEEKKKFKSLCQEIVDLIREVDRKGDATDSCTLHTAHELIDHLYSGKCPEKKVKDGQENQKD